jgi:hypothetical protein
MSEIPVYNAVPEEQDKQEALLALRAAQRREKGPKTTDTKPSRKSTVDGSLQLIVDNNDRSPGLHTQDGALRDKKTEYDSYLMNLDRVRPPFNDINH